METAVTPKEALREKGKKLLAAAYEFWEEHQKIGGPRAVVWLTDTDGKMVIFTRGEYGQALMREIGLLSGEIPLT